MLHVNDDIDDLFRKAGEDYPLKVSPDWIAVKRKMAESDKRKPFGGAGFALLLLLLLLSPLKLWFAEKLPDDRSAVLPAAANTTGGNRPVATLATFTGVGSNTVHPQSSPGKTATAGSTAGKISSAGFKAAVTTGMQTAFVANKKRRRSVTASGSGTIEPVTAEETAAAMPADPVIPDDRTAGIVPVTENVLDQVSSTPVASSEEIKVSQKESAEKGSAEKEKIDELAEKKEKKAAGFKHFYAGIIGGVDISAVKMQSVKKAGLSYGAVAGYRINKRLAIETGLLVDRKYYYTDGKYFNTKNIPLPNYVNIENASGSCDMLEIPVTIRYALNKKGSWTVAAGASSYLMKKEYYQYDISRYGVMYTRDFTYNDSDNTFFSVISLSVAWSFPLKKIGDIRIEPYIKAPVRKVGIGSLPLQSAGINVGLTRSLF